MTNLDYASMRRLIAKGQKAERRGKAWARVFEAAIVSSLTYLLRGYWLMLAVGILHHDWWPALPTIGYWWSVLVVSLASGVFSAIPPLKKDGAS